MLALDSPSGAKSQQVREASARILGCAAAKHGQLAAIAGALVDAVSRSEAVASAVAEICQLACTCFGDDRLVSDACRSKWGLATGYSAFRASWCLTVSQGWHGACCGHSPGHRGAPLLACFRWCYLDMASAVSEQAVELLRQVTAVDPGEYEQQAAHNDTAGVRSVAVFIVDLAERWVV